mmetsp:Transcript_4228/g.6521  ORF Transcript_4228/g.6521 Transcript_4228/m.6521 type:complete len:84 (-) Transcript_4228:2137-2388(-)
MSHQPYHLLSGVETAADLVFVFPERPKNKNQNTDVISTSSDSDCLVTQNSCNLGRLAPVGDEFLTRECDGILRLEHIEESITS